MKWAQLGGRAVSEGDLTMTHSDLVARAERWLQTQGCGVTIRDPFRAHTLNREQPDAIGWRDGLSILIECKISRADFLADRSKPFRTDPAKGMGNWRFYLCHPETIQVDDLPPRWGLLWATPRTIRRIHGVPGNTGWWRKRPFIACKQSETMMLVSALRRMALRGHLPEIYEGLAGAAEHKS
jgi:hypothetical protein